MSLNPKRLEEIKQVIKGAKSNAELNPDGTLKHIKCKGCGALIAGMVLSDMEPKQIDVGDKKIAVSPIIFARFMNYSEINIIFDDNSMHVTHACKACISKLRRMDKDDRVTALLNWYRSDIATWIEEITTTKAGDISEKDLRRTPIGMVN